MGNSATKSCTAPCIDDKSRKRMKDRKRTVSKAELMPTENYLDTYVEEDTLDPNTTID